MADAALIALDWGTTNVRAALLAADGVVLEERHGKSGVGHDTKEQFAGRFAALTDGWPTLPALAAGMVGSRQGWQEAAYLPCPTGLDGLSAALTKVESDCALSIVPGLKIERDDRFDVMRGEESQIMGLLSSHPDHTGTIVLPGTHSKWVRLERGHIVDFTTYMTGELFQAISQHTILRHSTTSEEKKCATPAFEQAVAEVFTGKGSHWARLFDIRGRTLLDGADNAEQKERLSGLLVGMELEAAARDGYDVQAFSLIGSPDLRQRYSQAAHVLQAEVQEHDGGTLIWPALLTLARHAGLVGS